MPSKGKILMGKGPVKRPTPIKPKPKAIGPAANPDKIGGLKGLTVKISSLQDLRKYANPSGEKKKIPSPRKVGNTASKANPTPSPIIDWSGIPAEGFGGYSSKTNKLIPMRPPVDKKVPKRVSLTRKGGK